MGKINWRGVLFGGLLGGSVAGILGLLAWEVLLRQRWGAALEALGKPLQQTAGFIVLVVVLYFAIEILAVWLYAAIRPRCGAGPRTAIIAGIACWLLSGLVPTVSWGSLGLVPASVLVLNVLVHLVILVVATLLGAWTYWEQEAPAL